MNETVFKLLSKILLEPIEISSLKLYAAVQMLRQTMAASTWKYPHAAFKSDADLKQKIEVFGNFLSSNFISSASYKDDFSKIYDELSGKPLADFLIEYTPELVTNMSETQAVLEKIDQHMSIETQCGYILDMRRVQALRASFSAVRRWELYQKLLRAKANSAPPLSDDSFNSLYISVNCYSLSFRSKIHQADKKAVEVMMRFHLPAEYLIQFYAQTRELIVGSYVGRRTGAIKEITSPAHYIRKRIGQDPKLDPLELDQIMNDAAAQIVKIKRPTDFLRALKKADDSPLEIGFVRPKFLHTITADDTVLIIDPSPDLILNWPEDLLNRTTFCVEYELEAQILSHEFPTANFICFDELVAWTSGPNGPYTPNYSRILMFGRDLPVRTQQQLLITSRALSPDGKISVLTSSVFLDQPTAFRWGASHFMGDWLVHLLPAEVAKSEPKRKIYLEEILEEQHKNSILLRAFDWVAEDGKWSATLEISPQPAVERSLDELTGSTKTLRMLYREQLNAKEKPSRNAPQKYDFTKDICFWYTVSNPDTAVRPKVEVYVCKLPTSTQRKRTIQARGAKIKSAYISTTKFDLKHISTWLEEVVPYDVRIHDGVIQALDAVKGIWFNLSLKSYWYLGLDVSKISEDPWFEMERELFSSSVGALTLLAEEEEVQEEMQALLEGKTAAEKKNFWTILSSLFDRGVREQCIMYNPIREYVEQFRERHTEFQEVRNALTKKSFRLEEERELLHILDEKLPMNGAYLGILIRYFTGLESNIVCALTWGDLHKLEDGSHQFWIQRQVSNDGKTVSGFSQVEDYRRLPIPNMLFLRLDARRKYIKEQLSLAGINDLPIAAPDSILLKDGAHKRLSPGALARASRKVILDMGIPEHVITLPDKANGVKETDLSSYRSDIFRSHIRYRLNITCGFTDAETRYFLGLTQMSTFGKHYCDFRHDCAQMLMSQKLRRWEVKLADQRESDQPPARQRLSGRKFVDISAISSETTVLDAHLRPDTDAGKITFDSPGGIRGDIAWN